MTVPIRNLYYLLSYAWNYVRTTDIASATARDPGTVPDMLAHVLSHGVARLISRGLDRSYEPVGDALRTIRGKIDLTATQARSLLAAGMVYCHYDELSVDVLQNRLLRSTLRRLSLLKELDKSVRASVERVYRKMDGVRTIRIDRRSLGSVQIHRNNRAYAFLLGICSLLHDSLSVDRATGQVRFAGVPEKHLAHLFEAFVRGFYRRELLGWEVSRPRLRWHAAEGVVAEGQLLPDMQTDIVLKGAGRRIIMDAKYYEDAFQVHHDKESVRSGHLYQIVSTPRTRPSRGPTGRGGRGSCS